MTTHKMVPLKAAADMVGTSLEEGYSMSQHYQWATELWRNFSQAVGRTPEAELRGDELQRFDMQQFHGGALKRTVWNTAIHMPEKELREYFTQIGKGHGNTWRMGNPTGNRHAGAREMLLPWNPAGVVVISYHPTELPEGAMVWMLMDDKGVYGMKQLSTGTEVYGEMQYDTVAPLEVDEYGFDWAEALTPEMLEHGGVSFVLLGQDIFTDDLIGVDPGNVSIDRAAESPTALANALLDRVAVVRGKVTVVYRTGSAAGARIVKTASSGKKVGYDSRIVYGADGWLRTDRGKSVKKHKTGVWSSEDGTFDVEWTLLDKMAGKKKTTNLAPYGGQGHVIARYRDEFMQTEVKRHPRLLSLWGVPYREVSDRLSLRVLPRTEGPGYHVKQGGASRTMLVGPDGFAPPWEDWADEFGASLPKPIADALAAVKMEHTTSDEKVRRLLKRIDTRMAGKIPSEEVLTAGEPSDDEDSVGAGEDIDVGRGSGGLGGGGGGGDGPNPGKAPAADPDGVGHRPVVRSRYNKKPDTHWFDADDWEEEMEGKLDGVPLETVFIYLTNAGAVPTLWFNRGHDLYKEQVAYWSAWADTKATTKKVPLTVIRSEIEDAYDLDSVGRMYVSIKRDGYPSIRKMTEDDLLLLTVGAEGYQNVDATISTGIGGQASAIARGKKTPS